MDTNLTKGVLKIAATGMSGIFAGAAFYINAADQPSRALLDTENFRKHWAEAFHRAKKFQVGLAVAGSLAAATVCYLDKESDTRYLWGIGAGILFTVVPFTKFFMIPDIKKLLKDDVFETAGETWVRAHLDRWNRLHLVRTIHGLAAFHIFLFALYKH